MSFHESSVIVFLSATSSTITEEVDVDSVYESVHSTILLCALTMSGITELNTIQHATNIRKNFEIMG
jgi:hypothetical protein